MKNTGLNAYIVIMLVISPLVYAMEQQEQNPAQQDKKLLWLGCKTSNRQFDQKKDNRVLEIAAIITDKQLNIIESESYIIKRPAWLLERIEGPLKEEYAKSGLLEKLKAATVESHKAEAALISFIDTHFPNLKPEAYMNDFWGRGDIMQDEMGDLAKRISIKAFGFPITELVQLWDPRGLYVSSEQPSAHGNALEALKELQHYKRRYFDPKP